MSKDRKYNYPIGNNKLNSIIKNSSTKPTTKSKPKSKSSCKMVMIS